MKTALILLFMAGFILAQPHKVLYKVTQHDSLFLHIYSPENPQENSPAIVFFFGGGWVNGDATHFAHHAEFVSQELGIPAFCADYRTFSKHQTSPYECVKDGKSAMRWVRQHAANFNIDPDRIVAAGGSAGGHVAACTSIISLYNEPDEDATISCQPNLLMLFNPVIDTSEKGYGYEKCGRHWKSISPAHHVRPGIPPTLIFHGTSDTTVPFENVQRFDRLMKENGNDCRLLAFKVKKHGFFNFGRDDNEDYEKTLLMLKEFLKNNQYIK